MYINQIVQNVNRYRKTPSKTLAKLMSVVSLGYSAYFGAAESTDNLPELSTPKPDVTNTKAFNQYHLCLQEYLKRRLKTLSVNSIFAYKRRSNLRIRKFWMRKRAFHRCIISSIIHKKNDIRLFTMVQIFGSQLSQIFSSLRQRSQQSPFP